MSAKSKLTYLIKMVFLKGCLFLLFPFFSLSQELELVKRQKPISPNGKIESVYKVVEDNTSVHIEVNMGGYHEADRKFFAKATVLNKFKGKIAFLKSLEASITSPQLEFKFDFDPSGDIAFTVDFFHSEYIEVEIFEDLGIGNLGIPKEKYLFRYSKKWGPLEKKFSHIVLVPYRSSIQIAEKPPVKPPKSQPRPAPIDRRTPVEVLLIPPRSSGQRVKDTPSEKGRAPINTERLGPKTPLELFHLIESDYAFSSTSDILNLFGTIYQDANPHSGYFYFVPAEYTLHWEPEKDENCGYSISNQYLSKGNKKEGGAIIKAELQPNISRSDLEIASVLIQNYLKDYPNQPFRHLVSMPLAAPPQLAIDDLNTFGVDPASVSIIAPSDLSHPVRVSWKMDRLEDLEMLLNSGVFGKMSFIPKEERAAKIEIPVSIKLDYDKTFKNLTFSLDNLRKKSWTNPVPFSMKLTHLHLLRIEPTGRAGRVNVYTWEMESQRISENTQVYFDAATFPNWLYKDKTVKKVWLEFTVTECDNCRKKIYSCITN